MPGRPLRAESLSVDAIVDTALQLAREGGLDGVRMRDVAAELDVAVGSIYHHIPNQATMRAAAVRRALANVPLPDDIPGSPRQRIAATVLAIQEALDRHPGISAAAVATMPESELGIRLRATFRTAGLSARMAERAYVGLGWLWLGSRVGAGALSYDNRTFRQVLDLLLSGLLEKAKTDAGQPNSTH